VPGYELTGWFGVLAPARTPGPVLDRLTAEVRKAVADPRFADRMKAQGLDVVGSSATEMLAQMQLDTKKWAEVIRATGTKIPQ
jgi:tripartite-type tricarboxylate transporter receptor subunit TctC